MIESVFTIIFIATVFILGLLAKKTLYVDEHVQSIQNELNTFNENFETLESIEVTPDYKIGSGHIYE